MPFLQELRDLTVPVPIKRGNLTFTLNAALERFTPEEGEYKQLRQEAVEIQFELAGLRHQLDTVLAGMVSSVNFEGIRADLEAKHLETLDKPQGNSKERSLALKAQNQQARAAITDADIEAEFNRRIGEQEKQAQEIRAQIDGDPETGVLGAQNKEHLNLAKRLAYLVATSDIVDAEGRDVLSGVVEKSPKQLEDDAQVFYKNFSVKLLALALKQVEEAIYGPLETASSSAE